MLLVARSSYRTRHIEIHIRTANVGIHAHVVMLWTLHPSPNGILAGAGAAYATSEYTKYCVYREYDAYGEYDTYGMHGETGQ